MFVCGASVYSDGAPIKRACVPARMRVWLAACWCIIVECAFFFCMCVFGVCLFSPERARFFSHATDISIYFVCSFLFAFVFFFIIVDFAPTAAEPSVDRRKPPTNRAPARNDVTALKIVAFWHSNVRRHRCFAGPCDNESWQQRNESLRKISYNSGTSDLALASKTTIRCLGEKTYPKIFALSLYASIPSHLVRIQMTQMRIFA